VYERPWSLSVSVFVPNASLKKSLLPEAPGTNFLSKTFYGHPIRMPNLLCSSTPVTSIACGWRTILLLVRIRSLHSRPTLLSPRKNSRLQSLTPFLSERIHGSGSGFPPLPLLNGYLPPLPHKRSFLDVRFVSSPPPPTIIL